MHAQEHTARRGITLVEILIVLAILVALLALLGPALAGAQDAARSIQCSSNLRQDHLQTMIHLEEHRVLPAQITGDGYLPHCPVQSPVQTLKYRYRLNDIYADLRRKNPRRSVEWISRSASVEHLHSGGVHIDDFVWPQRDHHNQVWLDGHTQSVDPEQAGGR